MPVTPDDIDHVLGLERELQSAGTRRDPARLRELLAPAFLEIGASGRTWDLDSTLAMLDDESGDPEASPIVVDDLRARVLCDDLVQVFWTSDRGGRRARRTSLWRRTDLGWQQVYHQGTGLP